MKADQQQSLFDDDDIDSTGWEKEWVGMPEYVQAKTEYHCIKISFNSEADMKRLATFMGQNIDLQTKLIHYPHRLVGSASGKTYDDES